MLCPNDLDEDFAALLLLKLVAGDAGGFQVFVKKLLVAIVLVVNDSVDLLFDQHAFPVGDQLTPVWLEGGRLVYTRKAASGEERW